MLFYRSAEEEAGALRRAAARVGCRVLELGIGATTPGLAAMVEDHRLRHGGRFAVGRIACRDGWQAARLVMALAAEDAKTEGAKALARELRAGVDDDRAYAELVQEFVKSHVRFTRDVGEVFNGPDYLLDVGEGDCEDEARLCYALEVAGGLSARLGFLHRGGPPTHAVSQVLVDGRPWWVETTVDAHFGEHPNAAALRLGLASERSDLSERVKFMSEKDLPPVPVHFVEVNAPDQVERDAAALAHLGFLGPGVERRSGDPTDDAFRLAVLAFQENAGIVPDGLVGPQTRRAIAGALGQDAFGMGYVAAITNAIPRNARMAAAWPGAIAAAESYGITSRDAIALFLAQAWGETRYGDPAGGWGDSHNWGGVTFNPARGEPFVSWGFIAHGDHDRNGNPVTYRFQAYPSDAEGAKDVLRVILSGEKRGKVGADEARAALEAADPDALAAALYWNGYFTGKKGTDADRIQAYAAMIKGALPSVKASAPAGSVFAPDKPILGGAAIVVAMLLGGGALAYFHATGKL